MNRKGITPVVATMLLMVIAVAAVGSASIFLQDTLTEIQGNLEDQVAQEDDIESSDINIEFAYNGTNGYLLTDVRNSGSATLDIEEGSSKQWNMYVEGRPENWEYVDSSLGGEVNLRPNEVVSINTTQGFPEEEESTQFSFNAPLETSDSYVCFNEGGTNC